MVGVLLLYAILLTPLLRSTLPLPLVARSMVALLTIAPAAVLLGMPFPLGLRCLDRLNSAAVPWAWGINGCLSVVGAAIATMLAVELGYSLLLVLAAGAYLVATAVPILEFGNR